MYSFITCFNFCIAPATSWSGLGGATFSCISWLFLLVIDCLLSVLVIETYDLPSWINLVCMLVSSVRDCDSSAFFSSFVSVMWKKNSFVNPYRLYNLCNWLGNWFTHHSFDVLGFLSTRAVEWSWSLRTWCISLYESKNFLCGHTAGN
jgi:hypothetical protein